MKSSVRAVALFLTLILCFGIVSGTLTASADSSGNIGASAKWKLDDNGTLTIYGIGDIPNYDYPKYAPWYSSASKIKVLVIGKGITSIGNWAFEECRSLAKVTILSEKLISVGEGAFCNCTALTAITLPKSVTSIKACAFYGCSALKSFVVPSKVTAIADKTFYWCTSLQRATLGTAVKSIGVEAFNHCGLKSINFPASLRTIADKAFYSCKALTLLTVPKGVATIGKYAFYNCSAITTATLPSTLTKIDSCAFGATTALQSINIDEANNVYSSVNGVLYSEHKTKLIAYPIGNARKVYNIISGVTTVCLGAFAFSKNLTSVGFPSTLKSIETQAFYSCNSIKHIILPSSVSSIGLYALNSEFKTVTVLNRNCEIYKNVNTITADIVYGYKGSTLESYVSYCNGQGTKKTFALTGSDLTISGLSMTASNSTLLKIKWNAVENATRYYIYMVTNGKTQCLANTTNTEYSISGLKPSTNNVIKVRAGKSYGSASVYGSLSGALQARTGPAAVRNFVWSKATPTSVNLSWSKVSGATIYQIYNKIGSSWKYVGSTRANEYVLSSLSPCTDYVMSIRAVTAYNKRNYYGTLSSSISFNTTLAQVVSLKQKTQDSNSVTLTWSAVSGAEGYYIYQNTENGLVRIGNTTMTSYTVSDLSANTEYVFRVRAYSHTASNKSVFGSCSSALKCYTGPDKVTGVRCIAKYDASGTATLRWNAASGAEGYQIYSYNDGRWRYLSKTSFTLRTIANVLPSQEYKIRVRAYRTVDGKTYTGNVSDTFTLSI